MKKYRVTTPFCLSRASGCTLQCSLPRKQQEERVGWGLPFSGFSFLIFPDVFLKKQKVNIQWCIVLYTSCLVPSAFLACMWVKHSISCSCCHCPILGYSLSSNPFLLPRLLFTMARNSQHIEHLQAEEVRTL